jgi:dTDP-glucose 4,6-dehydratase/UDP-glucose 4-epimerase
MQFSKLNHVDREVYAWLILDGETIFMTGGTGFFGTTLLYSLLQAKLEEEININITVLTRDIVSFSKKHPILFQSDFIHYLQGDVIDFDFPDKKFSKIVHLATTSARETFNGEDQFKKYKTLVDGTERVMQFSEKCGATKVLFTSSGVVYGNLPEGKVKEDYVGAPITTDIDSALGQGKRSAEFIISYYADLYNIDYVIARCFSFIGPGLPTDIHYAAGNFIRDALTSTSTSIKISGDGTQIRSYLDIRDLVVWILTLLSKNTSKSIYNVGSDCEVSIKDLAYLVRDITAPEKLVEIQNKPTNNTGNFVRSWYVPNIDNAKKDFNLNVWTSLEESIEYMYKKSVNNIC